MSDDARRAHAPPRDAPRDVDAEWADPRNWRGGALGLYVAPADPRVLVPKRPPGIGWTVNLARPLGRALLAALLLGIAAAVIRTLMRR